MPPRIIGRFLSYGNGSHLGLQRLSRVLDVLFQGRAKFRDNSLNVLRGLRRQGLVTEFLYQ